MNIPKPQTEPENPDKNEETSVYSQMTKLSKNEKKKPEAEEKPKLLGGSPEKSMS